MYHSFLIHSSADGHLGCFHVLAMINSAAMNIGVHVSLSDLVSLVSHSPFLQMVGKIILTLQVKDNLDTFGLKISLSVSEVQFRI